MIAVGSCGLCLRCLWAGRASRPGQAPGCAMAGDEGDTGNGRTEGHMPTSKRRQRPSSSATTGAGRAAQLAPWHGYHVCALFESVDDERAAFVSFTQDGLQRGDKVVHIIKPAERLDHLGRLRQAGVDVEAAEARGQLEVLTWADAYLRDGHFNPEAMLAFSSELLTKARAQGYRSTRVMVNMEWLLEDPTAERDCVAYEARLNQLLRAQGGVAICTYPPAKFGASTIVEMLRTHPAAVISGAFQRNPFFTPLAEPHGAPPAEGRPPEDTLQVPREVLAALVAHLPGAVYRATAEPNRSLIFVTPYVQRLTGIPPDEFTGARTPYGSVIAPRDREHVQRQIAEAVARRSPYDLAYRIMRADGAERWVEDRGQVVYSEADGQWYLHGVVLEEARRTAALEERQRLARELHDSVSQALYSIGLYARKAQRVARTDPAALDESLKLLIDLADGGLAEVRALIFELRPESFEQENLTAALRSLEALLSARHDLTVHTSLDREPRLTPEQREALYRIAREAILNVIKHAHARQVWLELRSTEGWVELVVRDDGIGFDRAAVGPNHFGLRSMAERAAELGGSLSVQSAEQGTTVRARIPLGDTPRR